MKKKSIARMSLDELKKVTVDDIKNEMRELKIRGINKVSADNKQFYIDIIRVERDYLTLMNDIYPKSADKSRREDLKGQLFQMLISKRSYYDRKRGIYKFSLKIDKIHTVEGIPLNLLYENRKAWFDKWGFKIEKNQYETRFLVIESKTSDVLDVY